MESVGYLARFVLTADYSARQVQSYQRKIYEEALASGHIEGAQFTVVRPKLLRWLFERYDELFFQGRLQNVVPADRIAFGFSWRLTSAGARTRVQGWRGNWAGRHFDITISARLLFDAFSGGQAEERVGGIPCTDRLSVLMRLMEHELIHVIEFAVWQESSCRRARFRQLIQRLFHHTEPHHHLVPATVRLAQDRGLQVGSHVVFTFQQQQRTGLLVRIRRRAVVLVEDPSGVLYNDGKRYQKYYVPVTLLQPANWHGYQGGNRNAARYSNCRSAKTATGRGNQD